MTTLQIVELLSGGIGLIAYLALVAFSMFGWRRRATGRAMFTAAFLSLVFVGFHSLSDQVPLTASSELLMLGSWLLLLLRALGLSWENFASGPMRSVSIVAVAAGATAIFALIRIWFDGDAEQIPYNSWYAGSKFVLCTASLVIIEQLVRNTRADLRSRMRYLNIGLGSLFGFGFVHTTLIMFTSSTLPVWDAVTPAVVALPVPFVIIASLRNAETPLKLNLSRQFMFGSGVLMVVGIGALISALLAYYIGLIDRDTGMATLVLLTVGIASALFAVVGSARIQARAQHLIGRHLLADEHDYREHWNRVTAQLTERDPDFTLRQQSIRALLSLFHAQGGALWRVRNGSLIQTASLHASWESPLHPDAAEILIGRHEEIDEIVDLVNSPEAQFDALREEAGLRFLVPLVSYGELFGVIGIANPLTTLQLSDEDREIVRLTARQITGFLRLREADGALSESRQFDTMNRLTTFLIHDLKTTSSQLSLLLQNAHRHKDNPAFFEDMLETVGHAVSRLDHLLEEIPGNGHVDRPSTITLATVLPDVVAGFGNATPAPILDQYNPELTLYIDRDRLISALQHVLQNAIEATDEGGEVRLSADCRSPWLEIRVTDTGTGMDQAFIDNELFVPFRSTKGVGGMGIGVYQVREALRDMGGELLVTSEPSNGTVFTLRIPLEGTA